MRFLLTLLCLVCAGCEKFESKIEGCRWVEVHDTAFVDKGTYLVYATKDVPAHVITYTRSVPEHIDYICVR